MSKVKTVTKSDDHELLVFERFDFCVCFQVFRKKKKALKKVNCIVLTLPLKVARMVTASVI